MSRSAFIALIHLNYLKSHMLQLFSLPCSFPLLIRMKRKQRQRLTRNTLSRKRRRSDHCPPSCLQSKCCLQPLSLPDLLCSAPSVSLFLSLLPSSKECPYRTKPQCQHLVQVGESIIWYSRFELLMKLRHAEQLWMAAKGHQYRASNCAAV